VSKGKQVERIAALAKASKPPGDFCDYWQRHKAG
jgi:hypothetical protein